jgi:hypothetical protein
MRAVVATVAVLASVLVVSACASSGRKSTTPITVSIGPPIPRPSSPSRQAKVARASDALFSIFSVVPGRRRCAIPEGGPSPKALRGECLTVVNSARTHEPEWIVTFGEQWHWPACPSGAFCPKRPPPRHIWRITVGEPIVRQGAKLHVYATRSWGATPPQEYK